MPIQYYQIASLYALPKFQTPFRRERIDSLQKEILHRHDQSQVAKETRNAKVLRVFVGLQGLIPVDNCLANIECLFV